MLIKKTSDVELDDLSYESDRVLILSEWELDAVHRALDEWVENNNIVKVQTVARLNNDIKQFLEGCQLGSLF